MTTLGHSAPSPSPAERPPWQSPVPYLFGALSAMLGLIAFALLMLATSYWKLTGYLDNRDDIDGDGDIEADDGGGKAAPPPLPAVEENRFLVIMAGERKPTFLATLSDRVVSIGSSENGVALEEDCEKKRGIFGNMEAH